MVIYSKIRIMAKSITNLVALPRVYILQASTLPFTPDGAIGQLQKS